MSYGKQLDELGIENMHIFTADMAAIGFTGTPASLTTRIIVAYEFSKQRSVTDEQGWTTLPSLEDLQAFLGDT